MLPLSVSWQRILHRNYKSLNHTLPISPTTANIKSSNHPLSIHWPTSNSSTTNFPWLTSTLQSNSVNCVVAPNAFKITPRQGPRTENTCHMFAISPVHWSPGWTPQKTNHVTATQPAHWRADRCLTTSYNIRPIVVYAYRGMFIEPLPSNALSKSVTICQDTNRKHQVMILWMRDASSMATRWR
jgi:hypothetical protein